VPIYNYKCSNCGHEFEILHGIKDKRPVQCPNCKKNTLVKQFTVNNIHFKGKGYTKKIR